MLKEKILFNWYLVPLLKVFSEGYLIKDASAKLKINYSTAKTILRVFRNENRYERKYEYSGISIDELYTDESYFLNETDLISPSEGIPMDIKKEVEIDQEKTSLEHILNLFLEYEVESKKNLSNLNERVESVIKSSEKNRIFQEIWNVLRLATDANSLLLSNARNIIFSLKKIIKN
jgi:hypothetical protein